MIDRQPLYGLQLALAAEKGMTGVQGEWYKRYKGMGSGYSI